jgi:hypothetical protein
MLPLLKALRAALMRLRSSEQEVNEELQAIDASLKVYLGGFELLKGTNLRRVLACRPASTS